MTDTSPIAFVPAKRRKPRGGLGTLILRLFGLTARQRAEYRVFWGVGCKFWFTHPDFAVRAEDAREHYRERLRIMSLDPADYVGKIEEKVNKDYWDSFDPNCGGPMADPVVVVPQQPAEPRTPAPGTMAHKRAEAVRTWHATGTYGLPSYGGHVLNRDERRELGLFDYRRGD